MDEEQDNQLLGQGAENEGSANALMGDSQAPGDASGSPSPPVDPLSQSEAQFDDLSMRRGLLDKILSGLTELAKKGDTVTSEDVTETAGRLVAAGLKPQAMASLLSQMPDQQEMLTKWIGNLWQMAQQRDAALHQELKLARHNMMTQALGTIMQTPAMGQPFQQTGGGGAEASPSSNPLMAQEPGNAAS